MAETSGYTSLTRSGFGAELGDVDLARLDEAMVKEAVDAFHALGGLVVIRNQGHIEPSHLRRFVTRFGTPEGNEKYDPAFLVPGFPDILRIGNAKENGKYTALFIQADPPPLLWHMDDSFRHPQPVGSCLFCIRTPPEGGETGFAGMTAAYEHLPDEVKARTNSIRTVHSYNHLNELLRKKNPHRPPLSEALLAQFPPIVRPLVARHPETGRKSLYLPLCHIESVEGMSPAEGSALLNDLQAHATGEDYTYMHGWRPGDLVVWDNRCTLHAPTPFDDTRYERLMFRLTFSGRQIAGF
ncbi:MAG: TauD/TfdA family dioxygenase [Gemmatimonadetes bacterium]|nr:TauD/TfdA family dioxygenase [Gemmatimonadota bacterium]MYB62168.1 TauD/TfdA family dioxygenase [Gemmatimonadota bacterium]